MSVRVRGERCTTRFEDFEKNLTDLTDQIVDFEKNLTDLTDQIVEYQGRVCSVTFRCMVLHTVCDWSAKMLDFLHQKLGVEQSTTVNTPEVVFLKLNRLVVDSGLFPPEDEKDDGVNETERDMTIKDEIKHGLICYCNLKDKDEAHALLNEMLRLDKTKTANESAQERNTRLGLQIELAKRLPVEKLYLEVVELINTVSHILENEQLLGAAMIDITKVRTDMNEIRSGFGQHYQQKNPRERRPPSDDVTSSLRKKADSFKELWEKKYGDLFARCEKQEPQRQ